MENLEILKGLLKEDIEVTQEDGCLYLVKVDGERFANIKIFIEDGKDKIFNIEKRFILEYNGQKVDKIFHKGDLQFSIKRYVDKLNIKDIDILPKKPIKVFVKSNIQKDKGCLIKYKTNEYIACGIVDEIKEVKQDGIEYSILVNNRIEIEG